jgi:hypothetical protein
VTLGNFHGRRLIAQSQALTSRVDLAPVAPTRCAVVATPSQASRINGTARGRSSAPAPGRHCRQAASAVLGLGEPNCGAWRGARMATVGWAWSVLRSIASSPPLLPG